MRTLDYARARGRCRRDEPRRDEPYTPVYEPGPIQRALMAAWDVLDFFLYSPLIWLGQMLLLACRAALAWIR